MKLVLSLLLVVSCAKEASMVKNVGTEVVQGTINTAKAATNTHGTHETQGHHGAIDLGASTIKWQGTKKIGDKHFGSLKLKSANLKMEGNTIVGGVIIVDMTSLSVEDIDMSQGAGKLTGHLKGDDFFSVEKYPTAKLVIKAMDESKGSGELEIKGVKKPITFTYSKNEGSFKGQMVFNRTDYGVKYGSGSFFSDLGDKVINDNVDIDFNIVLK